MISSTADAFLRHIRACRQIFKPQHYTRLLFNHEPIGWMTDGTVRALRKAGAEIDAPDATGDINITSAITLQSVSETLAECGIYRRHHEVFDVRNAHGQALGRIDRGAIPVLGVVAQGVHLNGLVETTDGSYLWIAQRSLSKRLDPGKLDHLVAGGMSTGLSAIDTVTKEAQEEAGIPSCLSREARPVGQTRYTMERPEGLRRDILHCYDLVLPEDFCPVAEDGEVESFALHPLRAVFECVRDTDRFKFNVNLVLIDLFLRKGLFSQRDETILRDALHGERSW